MTLEISGADIRILEIHGKNVTGWASASLDPGMFEEGVICNPPALAAAIRQLMTSSGIKDRNVIISINSLFSLSRVLTVPTVGEQPAAEQAIIEAAEAVMPLPREELYFAWQTIGRIEGGQQIMVTAMPRDVMDSTIKALRSAGINTTVLNLKTLALARAAGAENAIILNINADCYDIVILAGGFADVLRTTAWQPDGLSGEDKAEQLISAIDLTTEYYSTHHAGTPLDPETSLFITGHLSSDLPLLEAVRKGSAYEISPFAPPFAYPDHLPASQYAVNFGLAMKAAAASKLNFSISLGRKEKHRPAEQGANTVPDINLLPQSYKAWRPSSRQVYYTAAFLVFFGLIFPFYSLTTEAMDRTTAIRQKYAAINTQLERRKAEIAKRTPLQTALTEYESIIAMGGGLLEDTDTIRRLAAEFSIQLTAINHAGNSISFSCEAPDFVTFRNFINALQNCGRFASPVVPPEGYPYIRGGGIRLTPKP